MCVSQAGWLGLHCTLQAQDTAGQRGRAPPFNDDEAPQNYGTAVASNNDSTQLPIMEW